MSVRLMNGASVTMGGKLEEGWVGTLARVSSARPGVVHSFALAVHPAVAFGSGFFRGAALISNFAHSFFLGGVAACGFAILSVSGICNGGRAQQGQCDDEGKKRRSRAWGQGSCVVGCSGGVGKCHGCFQW